MCKGSLEDGLTWAWGKFLRLASRVSLHASPASAAVTSALAAPGAPCGSQGETPFSLLLRPELCQEHIVKAQGAKQMGG